MSVSLWNSLAEARQREEERREKEKGEEVITFLFTFPQVSYHYYLTIRLQIPVVQRVDNAIHRTNRYPEDK